MQDYLADVSEVIRSIRSLNFLNKMMKEEDYDTSTKDLFNLDWLYVRCTVSNSSKLRANLMKSVTSPNDPISAAKHVSRTFIKIKFD